LLLRPNFGKTRFQQSAEIHCDRLKSMT